MVVLQLLGLHVKEPVFDRHMELISMSCFDCVNLNLLANDVSLSTPIIIIVELQKIG